MLVETIRILVPAIQDYKPQILEYLHTEFGINIEIDRIEAKLTGLTPELKLINTAIKLPNNKSKLRLQKLQLWLDPLASLQHRTIKLAGLSVSGVQFTVQVLPNKQLAWTANSGNDNVTDIIKLLLTHGPITLLNGAIRVEQTGYKTLSMQFTQALLVPNKLGGIDIEVNAKFETNGQIKLLAHIELTPNIKAKVYLKTNNINLSSIVSSRIDLTWKLINLLNTELWIDWNGFQLDVIGSVMLHDITQSITANITTQWNVNETWNLQISNLILKHLEQNYDAIEMNVKGMNTNVERIRVAIAELKFEELKHSLSLLPLPINIIQLVNQLSPQGQIKDLLLEITMAKNKLLHWELGVQLDNISYLPLEKVPGISNLNLEIRANTNGGQARLTANEMTILAPKLFRAPLSNLQLNGDITWSINANEILINSDKLSIENTDLNINVRMLIQIPFTDEEPFVDLQGNISGDIAKLHKYFPVGVMKPPLINWLDQALVAGNLREGKFLLRGIADDFPFRANEGRFDAILDVENLTLNYENDWPRLENATGEIRFTGPGMAINLQHGKLLDSTINTAKSYVADIKPAEHIPINGQITGAFLDVLKILRGPLADKYARYVDGMEVLGDSKVEMNIAIPIESWARLQLDGQIYWHGADLQIEKWNLDLHDINGNVHFTDAGLFAQGIRANIGDHILHLDVDTEKSTSGHNDVTYLDVNFPLHADFLSIFAPQVSWQWLEGEAPANLRLIIPHETSSQANTNAGIKCQLDSDLKGLAINLPAPIGKAANKSQFMRIDSLLPLDVPQLLTLNYGRIQAALQMQSITPFKIESGEILSKLKEAPVANKSGLNIRGNVQRLDVPGWLAWINHEDTAADNISSVWRQTRPSKINLVLPKIHAEVNIGELGLATEPVKNLAFNLQQTEKNWDARIKADNIIGQIKIPNEFRLKPVQVKFDLMRLKSNSSTSDTRFTSNTTSSSGDPNQAPAMDVTVQDLQLDTQSLGKLHATLRPDHQGLKLKHLSLHNKLFSVTGTGTWYGNAVNQETTIHLEGNSKDFGEALRNLGFTSALQRANLQAKADLNWPGAFQDFAMDAVYGNLKFNMSAGQIVEVNPGVGRLFGILSLETLQRRLTLDFSDIFGDGFAFDSLTGNFVLQNGDAITQDIKILGPAADINISGRTGLVAKDYNQLISVTPAISSTLSIAAAIAGGPITGASLLVAGQVMGEQINKLMRLQYQLTGTWQQPNLVRVATQDGWSVSNLLVPK